MGGAGQGGLGADERLVVLILLSPQENDAVGYSEVATRFGRSWSTPASTSSRDRCCQLTAGRSRPQETSLFWAWSWGQRDGLPDHWSAKDEGVHIASQIP